MSGSGLMGGSIWTKRFVIIKKKKEGEEEEAESKMRSYYYLFSNAITHNTVNTACGD